MYVVPTYKKENKIVKKRYISSANIKKKTKSYK